MIDLLFALLASVRDLLELANPWGAVVGAALLAVRFVWTLVVEGFLAPTVKAQIVFGANSATVVVRNFEAIAVERFVNVEVEWGSESVLSYVAFRAGPWLHRENGLGDAVYIAEGERRRIVLRFNGLPADGALAAKLVFDQLPNRKAVKVDVGHIPGQSGNALNVRRIPLMTSFSGGVGLKYYLPRLLTGLVVYFAAAAMLFPSRDVEAGGATEVDAAVTLGGLVLVFLAWFVALPTHGKDTVCGFAEDVVWRP